MNFISKCTPRDNHQPPVCGDAVLRGQVTTFQGSICIHTSEWPSSAKLVAFVLYSVQAFSHSLWILPFGANGYNIFRIFWAFLLEKRWAFLLGRISLFSFWQNQCRERCTSKDFTWVWESLELQLPVHVLNCVMCKLGQYTKTCSCLDVGKSK